MKKISWSPRATGLWHRWKRFSTIVNASGEALARGQSLWEDYFADPSQWWDNRIVKGNQNSPDFRHKTTREALWLDGWSTPSWVKSKLTQTPSQPRRGRGESAQTRRSFPFSNGKESSRPTIKRELMTQIPLSVAVSKLKNDVAEGIAIDSSRYVELLESCYKHRDLPSTKEVHECSKKTGTEQNRYVANNLLRVYMRCGRIQEARQVFDNLKNKSVVTWNSMIGGYAQHGEPTEALKLLNQMDLQPNEVTYLSILAGKKIPFTKEVHAHIKRSGLESNVRVGTALLKVYAKSGSITEARQVFENLSHRDVISWIKMQQEGLVPNTITYISILNPSTEGALKWVKEVHRHAVQAGFDSDVRVGTALVHMYSKSGSTIDGPRLVFTKMPHRNIITWNVMIGGLAELGYHHQAYEVLLQKKA